MSAQPDVPPPRERLRAVLDQTSRIVLGQSHPLRLALACLLARGHLLLEDVPGVGKTTLAHALARTLALDYHRIQFTSDLLPADVLGTSIYQRDNGAFHFHAGPIFAQLVLADEINRAPPKTQSALLEAMEERQVTVEGETRALPRPFFVVATQNPREQAGTFPLPESQLDRFLMCVSVGFPDEAAERELLDGHDRRALLTTLEAVLAAGQVGALQDAAKQVHAADAILDYVQALLAASRAGDRFVAGLSPRAGLSLLAAARAWALLDGRDYLLPEDVQAVLGPVVNHRLQPLEGSEPGTAGARLKAAVPLP
jgi:MoxR-like ATPase